MHANFYDQTNSSSIPLHSGTDDSAPYKLGCERNEQHCHSSQEHSEMKIYSFIEESIKLGNYAVAISLINELIGRYPDSAVNYNNRGLMYMQNNQLSEALDDLTHALEINPRLDSAYNNRANCYAAQGDLIAAVSDYDEALDLNPSNLRAWINQGITYREMDCYDLALENFDIALILGNSFKDRIYAERGRTYHLRGDWNCAVADYRIALDLLSDRLDNQSYLTKVQNWLGDLIEPTSFL